MSLSNPGGDTLFFGRDERGIFLRAAGGIRAPLCWPLRESFLPPLENLASGQSVFVDLSACTYMDSTCIGLLVAADKRVRKSCGGRVHLVRPSSESRDVLACMGLGDFFPVDAGEIPFPTEMTVVESTGEKPAAGFVLDAHEALMETSDEAKKKFSLLSEVLRRSIARGKNPPGIP